MVGGVVVGITRKSGKVHLNLEDKGETICVYAEEMAVDHPEIKVEIKLGDWVWWQSGFCYWTPGGKYSRSANCGVEFDIKIPKIGYSH